MSRPRGLKPVLVFFHDCALYRAKCPMCGDVGLLREGRSRCCNVTVIMPDNPKVKREFTNSHTKRSAIPKKIRDKVVAEQEWCCLFCGVDLFSNLWSKTKGKYVPIKYHVDHLVPWCYDATHRRDNLVAACSECNKYKSGRVFSSIDEARIYILEKRRILYEKGHSEDQKTVTM